MRTGGSGHRRTAGGWLLAALILGLAGCGDDTPTTVAADTTLSTLPPTTVEVPVSLPPPFLDTTTSVFAGTPEERSPMEVALPVQAFREEPDGSLTVQVGPVPVEGSTGACQVDLRPAVRENDSVVQVTLLGTIRQGNLVPPDSYVFPGCPLSYRELTIEPSEPIGMRHLLLTIGMDHVWFRRDGKALSSCSAGGCPPVVEPAACDGPSLVDAVRTMDVPAHSSIGETRCQEPWAMVEVDIGSGACPPSDGGPNPCAGQRFDRIYLHMVDNAWIFASRDENAGCDTVLEQVPDLPRELCEGTRALS